MFHPSSLSSSCPFKVDIFSMLRTVYHICFLFFNAIHQYMETKKIMLDGIACTKKLFFLSSMLFHVLSKTQKNILYAIACTKKNIFFSSMLFHVLSKTQKNILYAIACAKKFLFFLFHCIQCIFGKTKK